MGTINPPSNKKYYNLVCTNYVTNWVKAKELVKETEKVVSDFLFEYIFVCFGVPKEIVTYVGSQFTSHVIKKITHKFNIQHWITSPYHPQANGKVESTNMVIEGILTKIVKSRFHDWENHLLEAIWDYKTTRENTIGFSPYELVYGKNSTFPIDIEIMTLRTDLEVNLYLTKAWKHCLYQLNELDEMCLDT